VVLVWQFDKDVDGVGMDQYLLIPFVGEWTSIYQLFWCELQGYKVLTHCHVVCPTLSWFGRWRLLSDLAEQLTWRESIQFPRLLAYCVCSQITTSLCCSWPSTWTLRILLRLEGFAVECWLLFGWYMFFFTWQCQQRKTEQFHSPSIYSPLKSWPGAITIDSPGLVTCSGIWWLAHDLVTCIAALQALQVLSYPLFLLRPGDNVRVLVAVMI
jgi:hypothetical protein